MALYEVIGTNDPKYLLADPYGADMIAIPCEPGNGIVKRGAIMYRTANGLWKPATTSELSGSYELAVINETVDTDANLTVAEDAAAFRAGRLVFGKVILNGGGTLSAANILALRMQNIVLDRLAGADEIFDNQRYIVTYKANNDASPAEDDYVDYKLANTSYTVLANSVTKFTAPSTKSFSKWNTKDDGSGTDYAAAASYTTDEALTLYAIWA